MNPQRLLAPLTPLYALGVALKNRAYDGDKSPARHLAWPVISVGNLSVGGAGKTPVVMRLAELMREEGFHADVLSRGYGRSGQSIERVDPGGDAARYGDEPLLIASGTGAPVYVGASRYQAGLLAEREAAAQGIATGVHLLDDGFQHRQLARTLDIVVLHASDFREWLLPAGRLREPLSAVRRANVLVLREEDSQLAAHLDQMHLKQPRWLIRRAVHVPAEIQNRSHPIIAFCGIARPQEFFTTLASHGVSIAAQAAFRDHRTWTDADLDRLLALQRQHHAAAFLTTEKDAIRLTAPQRARLTASAPLLTAPLQAQFLQESQVRAQLRTAIERPDRQQSL